MKKLTTFTLILLIAFTTQAQVRLWNPEKKVGRFLNESGMNKTWLKRQILRSSALFVAGALDGSVEIIKHDYNAFKSRFPNANENFFNPSISWKNKWKDGDHTTNTPAYFGSTTFLSWSTDWYHLGRTGRNVFIGTSLIITMSFDKKWYVYFIEAGINFVSYTSGFNLCYHGFFGHKY
jgi:hypothetical protein